MGNHTVDREKTESAIDANIKLSSMVVFEIGEKGITLNVPKHEDAKVTDYELPSIIKVEEHTTIIGKDGSKVRSKVDRSNDIEIGD